MGALLCLEFDENYAKLAGIARHAVDFSALRNSASLFEIPRHVSEFSGLQKTWALHVCC